MLVYRKLKVGFFFFNLRMQLNWYSAYPACTEPRVPSPAPHKAVYVTHGCNPALGGARGSRVQGHSQLYSELKDQPSIHKALPGNQHGSMAFLNDRVIYLKGSQTKNHTGEGGGGEAGN